MTLPVGAPLAVSVRPDVVAIDRSFTYAVPEAWQADGRAGRLEVGSMVRIDLHGRRVGGWVTEVGVAPPDGVELRPLARLRGLGPPPDLMDLARWAAWRWAGSEVAFLRLASPPRVVAGAVSTRAARSASVGNRPSPGSGTSNEFRSGSSSEASMFPKESDSEASDGFRAGPGSGASDGFGAGPGSGFGAESGSMAAKFRAGLGAGDAAVFDAVTAALSGAALPDSGPEPGARGAAVSVLRLPPAQDRVPVALAAVSRGDALVIVPEAAEARRVARALRRAGVRVAAAPDGWAEAAGGGCTVVGSRAAAWMPMPHLAAVAVFDEHDETLKSSAAPAWNARDVALERARRAGCPAVLTSPVPSLEALRAGRLLSPDRDSEREGWPLVEVIDRRDDDPVKGGLFAEALPSRLPRAGPVVCVLNRTGRSRLLACRACGELVRTADGRTAMMITEGVLVSADGGEERPAVCLGCGSTVLRNLRAGVARAREELEALLGEPVGEVTAATPLADPGAGPRVVIGTDAVLYRASSAAAVAFLDFDQELLAPRQRAAEQALALLARAARVLGGRSARGRLIVQTRQPNHIVLAAARGADPSVVAVAERDRRRLLGIPPYGAQAQVSGPGAEALIAALDPAAIEVRGPRQNRYLLRAPEQATLLNALSTANRPPEKVRIEVDPLRV